MYDAGKVVIGIIVFLVIASFPIWYAVAGGKSADIPELEKAAKGDNCVMETEEMRAAHMDLLNDWRKLVVRDGLRYYTAFDGEKVEMSMTKTCLGCHPNKDAFCDRCHNYMAVNPYCWDCHVNPKEFE